MQVVLQRYNTIATGFYNFYKTFGTNFWLTPYLNYGINISRVYFPKIAYQNNFEPEYTKTSNHGYIVVALIASTLIASRVAVAQEEEKTQGHA